jgi:LCP family protein required for cell wall assembly
MICSVIFAIGQLFGGSNNESSTPVVMSTAILEELPEGMIEPTIIRDPLSNPNLTASNLDKSDRINILILGTDGRKQEDGPPRTDLMMLVLLNRTTQHATLISIPRDLWVPIPAHGEGKINTAYFLGGITDQGPELAQATVENLVGLSIDHLVEIDFNGFRSLVDQMGGIVIDVPEAIDDPQYPDGHYGTLHLEIPAGRQRMDGETALSYARTRYGGTDFDRSARQQAVLMALRSEALKPSQLAKAPLYLRTIYNVVESELSLADFFALARFGRNLKRQNISMRRLDGDLTWSVLTWNEQDALLYDPEALEAAILEWSQGK